MENNWMKSIRINPRYPRLKMQKEGTTNEHE